MSNLPNHSPNMVMSRDSGFNFRTFLFLPNSVLNFRKSYQIFRKLTQEQKSYKQKTNWGGKQTPPPPPPRVLIGLKGNYKGNTSCSHIKEL